MSDDGEVSSGTAADSASTVEKNFPEEVRQKFEIFSYRSGASILKNGHRQEYDWVISALQDFQITEEMIRMPGGNKGPIAKYVDTLFTPPDWIETRISADLHVSLHHAKKKDEVLNSYVRKGYLDGHRIDFVSNKVAFDLEWNSKDQTYDRDLYAFSAFYNAGAIDVGIILTRGSALDSDFFRGLGKVLNSDGTEGSKEVLAKFGASTTWMGKLLYRLDAGRNGGCPIIAIGITPSCVVSN